MGDGIAIAEIEGVYVDEVSARMQNLAHQLLEVLHRDGHASIRYLMPNLGWSCGLDVLQMG